eukprot:3012265-Rhodomonas_salina.1
MRTGSAVAGRSRAEVAAYAKRRGQRWALQATQVTCSSALLAYRANALVPYCTSLPILCTKAPMSYA